MKKILLPAMLAALLLCASCIPAPAFADTVYTSRLTSLQASQAIKVPVKAATTANVTLSGEQTIDGIALVAGDRVLVKNQSTASQNGIYVVATTAWSRAADFDGALDIVNGTIITVNSGTANANSAWKVSGTDPITIGTDAITLNGAYITLPLGLSVTTLAASSNTTIGGTLGVTGVASFANGSITAPSLTFTSDPDTGIYRAAANTLALTVGGVDSARFNTVASGVNYLSVIPGSTGNGVALNAAGSDSDISLNLNAKGVGAVNFNPGGGVGFSVGNVVSSVNYVQVSGAATNVAPAVTVGAAGSDSNITLQLSSKGTGNMQFFAQNAVQLIVQNVASAVDQITLFGGTTGNPGTVTVSASGSDTNINLALTAKGTGDLVASSVLAHTTGSAANVVVDGSGHILKSTSSLRYKNDVQDVTDDEINEVLKIEPITYLSNARADDPTIRHFGFIAERMDASVDKKLVSYIPNPDPVSAALIPQIPDGVQYERIIVPLVGLVKKMKAAQDADEATIHTLTSQLTALTARVTALEAAH